MVDAKIVREWMQKADEDLDFAVSIVDESPFYAQICFHFQQAAEKYLKSVIIADELDFQKIHDLVALLKSCMKNRPDLGELMSDCKLLNGFYIDTRYPVHWPSDYSKETALEAMKAAEEIRDKIKAALSNVL